MWILPKNITRPIMLFLLLGSAGCATFLGIFEKETPEGEVACGPEMVMRGHPPPDGDELWCRTKSGINQGPWKMWHKNDRLSMQGAFLDGKWHGLFRYWDVSGILWRQVIFENGKLHGSVMTYWPHGQKQSEGVFDNNLKDGLWRFYYPSGTLWKETPYQKGLIHGKVITWYPDGVKKEEKQYVNDELRRHWNYDNAGGATLVEISSEEEGDIDVAAVKRSLKAARVGMRQCYEAELRQDQNTEGRMLLDFTVGLTGLVELVDIKSSTVPGSPLISCVLSNLERTRFPKAAGAPVIIGNPFSFSSNTEWSPEDG